MNVTPEHKFYAVIARNLRRWRTANNMTVADLAEMLEVSKSTYSAWEQGAAMPLHKTHIWLTRTGSSVVDMFVGVDWEVNASDSEKAVRQALKDRLDLLGEVELRFLAKFYNLLDEHHLFLLKD